MPPEPGEILTFYSYKGGTGRSMALANTACVLAQQPEGHDGVLIVDWDLEAPGLHRYFADRFHRRFDSPGTASADLEAHPGLIDFFIALAAEIDKLPPIAEEPTPEIQAQLRHAVNLDSYILQTDVPNISLLKAGAFDESYAKRVNTFPWEPLYQRAPWVITLVADWFTSRFRYTLIDSRTGITDTSGICTMLLPDKLVAVFTPNQQSLDGVLQMVERSTNYRRRSSDMRPLSVFPLPSRIETSEPELRERWRKGKDSGYQPRFEALFRKIWELDDCNLDAYFNEVQIQHASSYAYGEKVSVLLEKSNDRTSLRRAYSSFVERLALDEPWDVLEQPPAAATATTATAEIAESLHAQLKPAQQDAAKRLFLQLINVAPNSPKPAAGECELKLLTKGVQFLVESFVAGKVLSLREADGKTTVLLADENLVFTWRRLSDWIASDLEFLRWRNGLNAAKMDWDKFGHSKEGLLRGLPLQEAKSRLSTRSADLNLAEVEYIKASSKARTRRKILQWTVGVVGGLVGILGLMVYLGLKMESRKAEAMAVLEQGSIAAAIRAERLDDTSPQIDARLRRLLRQFPQPVAVLPDASGDVAGMIFNQDATRLAVAFSDRVSVYSLKSGAPPFQIRLNQARSLTFSPGGKWFAAGGADGTRILHNLQTGQEYSVPFGGAITDVVFSANDSRIATAQGGTIYLSTLPDTETHRLAHTAEVKALAFSPDGGALASAGGDRIALWRTDTGSNFATLLQPAPVMALVYSPDGKYLAAGSWGGKVWLWLSKNQAPPLAKFVSVSDSPGIEFSPDSRSLAYIDGPRINRVYLSDHSVAAFSRPAQIVSFAFAPANRILMACADGTIFAESPNGSVAEEVKWAPDGGLKTSDADRIAFSKDGTAFAVKLKTRPIIVYRPEPAANNNYQALHGSVLADAACGKLKPLASINPDYSKGCPAR